MVIDRNNLHPKQTFFLISLLVLLFKQCEAFQKTLSIYNICGSKGLSSKSWNLYSQSNGDITLENDMHLSSRNITVSKSIKVPFSADVAFDGFSDLTRQADFSPWLRKVEYLNPPPIGVDVRGKNWGETKWYMGFRGFSITWNSICTVLDKPNRIRWESTKGMKNFGEVVFVEDFDTDTNVTLTMTFVFPRIAAAVLRRSSAIAIANFVENKMLYVSLKNFRDAILEENCEESLVEKNVSELAP
mmetsp:Transcript_20007/g.30074  ORF Transcript_20007/g.30074 Transcript_20007/m.30074 type:complete len:244 (-) Transcript_20007:2714-3445(-)